MPFEENLDHLVDLQDQATDQWHSEAISIPDDTWLNAALGNHSENYQLWHQEDKARRDDMGFEYVYNAKRAIDAHNQKRNNLMEVMDNYLFDLYNCDHDSDLPMHSETPGMMIDRLSIMSLKIYHMALQTKRANADDAHKAKCLEKLQVLKIQRNDLKNCVQTLLTALKNNEKTFKLYKQMKMYNEKSLNPQLYKNQES
jgi:hypothetical protein